jgi:hypothetical protein
MVLQWHVKQHSYIQMAWSNKVIYSMEQILLEKLTATQLIKQFSYFYEAEGNITVFTRAHYWTLS